MARGNLTSPPATSSLPKVEYEIINDDKLKLPGGVHDQQARTFGYNDYSDFRRPDHYIRHIEPLESDLAKTVEYDMDEQDQEWLDAVNVERTKAQIDRVSSESFEIIMDRLEKEWFDLTKNIPKPDFAMPSEDSTCAICDDSEGENSNAIVFCDGCNLAVHQDCYGVPYIPEGQWLCRKCTVSPENPVECYLCPNEGGAFKQTVHGEWVHLLCAIWIPETRVANDVFMEPITGVERISKQRWKLRCSICDIREGACIQCTKPSCFVAFHATCARKEKLLMPMKSAQGAEPASLTCFCDRHLPQEQQEARAAALALDETRERTPANTQLTAKSARAYAKTYKPGPPLVPAIIVGRIVEYIYRIRIRKKQEFVQQMCRYWSLKREVRRGAPLLKRLHLEPWTANAGAKVLSEEEKWMRLDQLTRLRQDLINVRGLTDLVRKRETRKLRQTEVIYEVFSQGLFPHHASLRLAFERIMSFDRHDHFKNPVLKHDVPDYFDVIKKPMCWSVIDTKLDQHQYWDLQLFRDDIELVVNNALLYNKAGTIFHKSATRIQKESRAILNELESLKYVHSDISSKDVKEPDDPDALPPIGDLEPPLEVFDLLTSSDAIKQDLNMELEGDPVSALINYEFAKVKPPPSNPPSPPAPPPRQRKTKPKRDRKAEAERARINREARVAAAHDSETQKDEEHDEEEFEKEMQQDHELQAELDASTGFRAPRTRGARAAAAAFEAEARGSSSAVSAPASAGPSQPPESLSEEGKPANKPKKRASVAPVSQPSVPRVVHDVGNRDSFSMFNAGWILPPDQKRGGRVPTERQALPPPRKRQKTDHATSRLSIVSTAPSDNYTLRKTPPWSSDPHEAKHNPNELTEGGMDVDAQGDQSFDSRRGERESISRALSVDDAIEEPLNVVTQPNGVVIIEKLDTPATRREKNIRRKAEKQRQAARALEEGVAAIVSAGSSNLSVKKSSPAPAPLPPPPTPPIPAEPSPPPPPSDLVGDTTDNKQDDDFDESELSELSSESDESAGEDESEEERPAAPRKIVSASTRTKSKKPGRPKKPAKTDPFADGTIVWAKSESYPWWPAVVHSDTSGIVPNNILITHKEKRQRRKIKLYIVQYYDKQSSWQSVPRDKLQLLGEDKKLDEEMLSSNQKQKWKASASKQQCREAYRIALAEMDMEDSSVHPADLSQDGEDADGESES